MSRRSKMRETSAALLCLSVSCAALNAQTTRPAVPVKPATPFVDSSKILHRFDGEVSGGQFGWVAGNAGDVDKDGVNDIIVGAPTLVHEHSQAGRIYVYSGKSGKRLFVKTGKKGDLLGYSVGGTGDVNHDGHDDFIAGAPGTKGAGSGRAYVWSGKDGSLLHELTGQKRGDRFGVEAGGIGDFDGDGTPDFLVGADRVDAPAVDAGRVYIYSGKGAILVAKLDGERGGDNFGRAAAGKFTNGSGLLVVGAPKAGTKKAGKAYIYRGEEGKLAPAFSLDADKTGKSLGGMFVSVIGDINGDGNDDVYVSDWQNNLDNKPSGRVYLLSGKDGKILRVHSGRNGEGFGIGNAIAGDVNGDGHADLIVGAWSNSEAARLGGKAYLISGKDGKTLRSITCKTSGDNFGFDATGLGDVNGDGKIDFLITSAWSSIKGPKTGRVFVIAGQ